MKMYRAVRKRDLESNCVLTRLPTSRVPTNVPYLVDNIWEYLRPAEAPSRRQAIYASPAPELALASASTATRDDDGYVVCEVEIDDPACRIAHLSVEDAKFHADIKKVMRFASAFFPGFFADRSDQERLGYAPLFMPASPASEVGRLLARPELTALYAVAQECMLWKEAALRIMPDRQGELFFELSDAGVCRFKPVSS
ncbi:MAG TPA: hypothetical protein VFF81_12260 [Noviherbaspirillum sp.]|nr:hypothetical protein [Noviherbaspirillum sp.]